MMNKVTPADLPAEERPELDAGIAEVVQLLAEGGFHTTDSGDGVSKPADERVFNVPHVAATVAPEVLIAESERMARLLGDQWHVQATYSPDDKTAVLLATRDAAAPAEERETPVEQYESRSPDGDGPAALRSAFETDGPHGPLPVASRRTDARSATEARTIAGSEPADSPPALPAEDRAVTAPPEPERPMDPECIKGAFEVLYHVRGMGARYRCHWCRAEAYTHGVEFPHGVDCPTRTLRKQADQLAVLAHAIEALRGEMERLIIAWKDSDEHANHAAFRVCASELESVRAANLKEWEGRHDR